MYMSVKMAAKQWGISERRVRVLCEEGRVDGAVRISWAWNIPSNSPKPSDGRSLRHKKSNLRLGKMDFARFEVQRKLIDQNKEAIPMLSNALIPRLILGLFQLEGLDVKPSDLAILFQQSFVPHLSFESQIIALNMRSLLRRMRRTKTKMSEQQVNTLYTQLFQGLDDNPPQYREASIHQEMEILFLHYEQEWVHLHPIARSLFLFGQLMRIRPYNKYNSFIAALAFSEEMIKEGYLPVLVNQENVDEFRAALLLTNTQGNYQNLLTLLEGQHKKAVERL